MNCKFINGSIEKKVNINGIDLYCEQFNLLVPNDFTALHILVYGNNYSEYSVIVRMINEV